jgi:hypothetical protein
MLCFPFESVKQFNRVQERPFTSELIAGIVGGKQELCAVSIILASQRKTKEGHSRGRISSIFI